MPGKHDKYQIDIIKMNLNTAWQTQDHARAALDPVLLPSPPHPSFPALTQQGPMKAYSAADPAGEGAPGAVMQRRLGEIIVKSSWFELRFWAGL